MSKLRAVTVSVAAASYSYDGHWPDDDGESDANSLISPLKAVYRILVRILGGVGLELNEGCRMLVARYANDVIFHSLRLALFHQDEDLMADINTNAVIDFDGCATDNASAAGRRNL